MRAPLRYPKLTRAHVEQFRELERAYHVRAFGEELARVNLDMTKDERLRYLQWMRDHARKRVQLRRSTKIAGKIAGDRKFRHDQLRKAVYQVDADGKKGILERTFALAFRGVPFEDALQALADADRELRDLAEAEGDPEAQAAE